MTVNSRMAYVRQFRSGFWIGPLLGALTIAPQFDGSPNWAVVWSAGAIALLPIIAILNAFSRPQSLGAVNLIIEFSLGPIVVLLCLLVWTIFPRFPAQWAFAVRFWYVYPILLCTVLWIAFKSAMPRWRERARALEASIQCGVITSADFDHLFMRSEDARDSSGRIRPTVMFGAVSVPVLIGLLGRGGLFGILSLVISSMATYFITILLVRHYFLRKILRMSLTLA